MKNRASLLLLAALAGCNDKVADGADGSTSSDTASDASTDTGASDTTGGVLEVPSCGIAESCGVFSSPNSCNEPNGCGWTDYLDEHRCGLMLLAAGEVGVIDYGEGCEGMCYGELVLVRAGDRTAVRQSYYDDIDLGRVLGETQECMLMDAGYFETCLAAYDEGCLSLEGWFSACEQVASFECSAMQ